VGFTFRNGGVCDHPVVMLFPKSNKEKWYTLDVLLTSCCGLTINRLKISA
jgi:hypothetical protein